MNHLPLRKNRRVLVIDDNRAIHDDFRKILAPANTTEAALDAAAAALFGPSSESPQPEPFEVDSAFQGQEGFERVAAALEAGRPFAVAFVDVRMPPGWDGVETTRKLWELDPHLQVVLCTAYSDYSWGEIFERLGQRDGLLILKKPFDAVEALQLAHALTEKWALFDESRRKMEELECRVAERTLTLQQTNDALQMEVGERKRAQSFLDSVVDNLPIAVFIKEARNLRFVLWNKAGEKLTGIPNAEMIGKTDHDFFPAKDADLYVANDRAALASGGVMEFPEEITQTRDHGVRLTHVRKVPILDSGGEPAYLLGIAEDISERKLAENALRESHEKFQQMADNITDAFWIRSADLRQVLYLSPAAGRIWDRSMEFLYADPEPWTEFVLPEDRDRVREAFVALTRDAPGLDIEYRITRPDGELRWVRVRGFKVLDDANNLIRHTGIVTDITERKQVECQLLQSQKLETVGKLAGGIAHEFNSILTAIIGQSELILGDLPPSHPLSRNAAEISKAAGRAATLTRQLLAYGRRTFLRPEPLNLNTVLAGMEATIRHVLGVRVVVRIVPAPDLGIVKADAGQIEQVILHLVMNAADAMPDGGQLTMETSNTSLDHEAVVPYPDLNPGEYVVLAVTDTGAGMTEDVVARIFEPFFTTKGVGRGSGLGLSTGYGIIKQSGGHLSVRSEPGRGTTFCIYLPQLEPVSNGSMRSSTSSGLPRGTETILLVEADPALREMAATVLERLGYRVIAAGDGIEALTMKWRSGTGPVDLLFTDVVMPRMSGKELADRLIALSPHTRTLFTSACTENAILQQGTLNPGVALLQKPFTPSALAHKIREVLDQPMSP